MIPVNRRTKIFVYKEFVDMRSSYDSLCFKVQNVFKQDPFSGHMFLFINKKKEKRMCIIQLNILKQSKNSLPFFESSKKNHCNQ